MGGCCNSANQPRSENFRDQPLEEWYLGNENFDIATYNKSISFMETLSFQTLLESTWKKSDMSGKHRSPLDPITLDQAECERLGVHIQSGVPNFLVKKVIQQLIPMNDDMARTSYYQLAETNGLLEETLPIPPNLEPNFGRKKVTNLFLSKKGVQACKRILFLVSKYLKNSKVCLVLPRVAQILLWFLKEHEVYHILIALLNENYFPLTLKDHLEELNKIDFGHRDLLRDLVYNMLVGYISPSFYPQVLCYFLVFGMEGIYKFAFALIKQHAQFIALSSDSISACKKECFLTTEIGRLIVDAKMIEVPRRSPDRGYFFTVIPPFSGASYIMKSFDNIHAVCKNLPEKALFGSFSVAFSTQSDGCDSAKFIQSLHQDCEALVILIETKSEKQFGVYLDKNAQNSKLLGESENRLFMSVPSSEFFVQRGTVSVHIDLQTGFRLVEDQQKCILHIFGSLESGESFESRAFMSPVLYKEQFQIYNLEVFLINY